jgi:hypothetical protein
VRHAGAVSSARAAIALALAATVAFSFYLAYVAWSSSSFPVQEKPLADYAAVASIQFNGTELYFKIQWKASTDFVPRYAQITSAQTDSANSPVCDIGLGPVATGQMIDMPFTITSPKQTLASVDLEIAIRVGSTMTEFTIVHHLDQIDARPGNILPSEFACSQPTPANL